jgi:hypothetical protein
MLETVRAGLSAHYDSSLVDELLAAYVEAKENFHLGGLRLAEVEGGRFCEAAFRMLEQDLSGGSFTPLGVQLDTERLINQLRSAPSTIDDSVRLHIPRALRVVYDIRNKRDAAHLGDGIDPNLQDASMVNGVLDWVLAEFVRREHQVSADEAKDLIETIVERKAPVIQDFDGFLKVLNPNLTAGDHCLVLLHQRGPKGATLDELTAWARPEMKGNLRRTLARLTDALAYVHGDDTGFQITRTGIKYVEDNALVQPQPTMREA